MPAMRVRVIVTEVVMQTLMANAAGVRLVVNLNLDRLIYGLTLAVALVAGAAMGSVLFPG